MAERLIKIAKPPLTRGRGGFPIENQKENHFYGFALSRSRFAPGCVCFGGCAKFY